MGGDSQVTENPEGDRTEADFPVPIRIAPVKRGETSKIAGLLLLVPDERVEASLRTDEE